MRRARYGSGGGARARNRRRAVRAARRDERRAAVHALRGLLHALRRDDAAVVLAEFGGEDFDRVVAAAHGLGALLKRGHDAEVEDALLGRLKDVKELVGPTMEEALGSALMSVWPLYLLQELGTPEAMASLRHAAASHPDPEIRQEATWRSERLGKWRRSISRRCPTAG